MTRLMLTLAATCALGFGLTVPAEMTFDRAQLALTVRDGLTAVSYGRCVAAWETGAPSLPIAVAQLVVPQGMKVTAVRLDVVETETIPGAFDVYPVQPPRPLSDPGPFKFAPSDPKYYGSAYPREVATAGHQGSMFGYNIASVFVAPVQYNGADKSLVFHPRVRFTLELEPADLGYLRPGSRSPESRRRVEAQIAALVLNPQDVAVCAPR